MKPNNEMVTYFVQALCIYSAYLAVKRVTERHQLKRQALLDGGIRMADGRRSGEQAWKREPIE